MNVLPAMMKAARFAICLCLLFTASGLSAQKNKPFKVIGFFTAKQDQAHISYVHEANKWLARTAQENNFTYDSTNDWNRMTAEGLKPYDVVLFLDTRPEKPEQRTAFEAYMKGGGAWMGFHFAAFAMTPSAVPQNWDWYHNEFLGSGEFVSNTWRPTSAILRVEAKKHPALKHLKDTFHTAPNEWYRWKNDLRLNKDIKILLSIDSASFPLGTGPKQWEIWHSGYYPVVWTNIHYRMLYVNMGHNDIDYEHGTNKELSLTFDNARQGRFLLDALLWLGKRTR